MARARVTPAQLTRRLQRLLCSLTTPQAWEELVTAADAIGRYTARNRALILSQDPQATSLAGSATWARHGRQIPGGQRGLSLVAVTRSPGGGNAYGPQVEADVLAPDLRPPHEQTEPAPVDPYQKRERWRGESSATVIKVWDVRQTVKVAACAACGCAAQVPCAPGCRGIPGELVQAVPPVEWWQLVEELPEGVDPNPVWDALSEVVFLV